MLMGVSRSGLGGTEPPFQFMKHIIMYSVGWLVVVCYGLAALYSAQCRLRQATVENACF